VLCADYEKYAPFIFDEAAERNYFAYDKKPRLFPPDFMFQINYQDVTALRSQIATLINELLCDKRIVDTGF
jgi:hypothetical protein